LIRSFKHKGLEQFFCTGSKSGIQAKHAVKLRLMLGWLNVAVTPKDLDLPGLSLHSLSGKRSGTWSISVSGNWRITFQFRDGHAERVNYEDYH
jgi:proteic killer suppression protein